MKYDKRISLATTVTILIILLLILSQPASSLLVQLQGPDEGIEYQETTFTGVITIHSDLGEWAIVFRDSSGSNVTGLHLEVNVSGSSGQDILYVMSADETNYVDIPLTEGSNITLNIFSPNTPPRKKTYDSAYLQGNATVNITLPNSTEFKDPLSGTPLEDVGLKFIKSSCSHPYNASSSCVLYDVPNASNFNPMKALMAGNLNIRTEQQSGMVVEFINIDIIRSGPPDASFSPTPDNETSGNTFAEVWQIGSFAPDIYDHVLIGVPYNESKLNESKEVRINFSKLYDDNFNVIWNASIDNQSDVAALGSIMGVRYG